MFRMSARSARFAIVGGLLPPFCGIPPWHGGGSGGSAGEGAGGEAHAGADSGGSPNAAGAAATGGDEAGGEAGAGGQTGGFAGVAEPVLGCAPGAWPENGVFEILPPADPSGTFGEIAHDVSADGEVIVGTYFTEPRSDSPRTGHPVAWSPGAGWYPVDEAAAPGVARMVNCDGTVIAGWRQNLEGFIKVADGPLTFLRAPAADWVVLPWAISASGTRIAGYVEYWGATGQSESQPKLWNSAGEELPFDPPFPRSPHFVSSDGKLVAGEIGQCDASAPPECGRQLSLFVADVTSPTYAEERHEQAPTSVMSPDGSTFASSADGSSFGIPGQVMWLYDRATRNDWGIACPGQYGCGVAALSSRAAIIVGNSQEGPFLWTAKHGTRYLFHMDTFERPADWHPIEGRITAMSDDGRVLVGNWTPRTTPSPLSPRVFRMVLPRRVYE